MSRRGKELIYRHSLTVRLWHWLNVLCIAILLMSGLQIFNAHPRLYWGDTGNEGDPAIFEIYAEEQLEGPPIGWTKIGNSTFDTTGVLGVFTDFDGFFSGRAFPYWITLPSNSKPRGRAALALLLRLALCHQRVRLSDLRLRAPPFSARHRADRLGPPRHRPHRPRPSEVQTRARRGGQALQRASEAHLHRRHLRAVAADGGDRPLDVARRQLGRPLAARAFRRTPIGAHRPFRLRCC